MEYLGQVPETRQLRFKPAPPEDFFLARVANDILLENWLGPDTGSGEVEDHNLSLLHSLIARCGQGRNEPFRISLRQAEYLAGVLQTVQLGERPVSDISDDLAQQMAGEPAAVIADVIGSIAADEAIDRLDPASIKPPDYLTPEMIRYLRGED